MRIAKLILFSLFLACAGIQTAWGNQIKAYVTEFSVTGAANRDELQPALLNLLKSRLSGDGISVVDTQTGSDVLVAGSYTALGKMFSMDAVAKTPSGAIISRSFVQGESADELIPALGKLAQSLRDGISKGFAAIQIPAPVITPPQSGETKVKATAPPIQSDIIKPENIEKTAASGWISQRIPGALTGLALVKNYDNGEKELILAGKQLLQLYRQGKELKLLDEIRYKSAEVILSVDAADLDGDGVMEAYITVMDGEVLASQVWGIQDGKLHKIADKQPYFFRGMALDGKNKRIYAQQMGRDADFYGDVYELAKKGNLFELQNPIKMPRFGFLYNFNTFVGAAGKKHFIVINGDGYLIVYSEQGEELWRSSDRFGGSELYFKREDYANMRISGDQYRWTFLEQRITVTGDGNIIVPRNEGFFVVGNNRSYTKSSLYCFSWNGSALEEKWHTKTSQNYLADYAYDSAGHELVQLEVVKKEGLLSLGASAISIKKTD